MQAAHSKDESTGVRITMQATTLKMMKHNTQDMQFCKKKTVHKFDANIHHQWLVNNMSKQILSMQCKSEINTTIKKKGND